LAKAYAELGQFDDAWRCTAEAMAAIETTKERVRIVDGAQVLACRSYDKGAQIEDAGHVQALVQHKHAARRHRGTDHLAKAAPESQTVSYRQIHRERRHPDTDLAGHRDYQRRRGGSSIH